MVISQSRCWVRAGFSYCLATGDSAFIVSSFMFRPFSLVPDQLTVSDLRCVRGVL